MRLKNVKRVVSFIIAMTMVLTLVPSVFAAAVSEFTDFPTGWSKEAMTAAVNNGLLNGRTATEIVPEGELTRAEMVTIINRAFGATIEANITSYLDVPANAWYYHEIAKGVNMQTIQGDSASIMRPDDAITREEVFTIIARALVLEDAEANCLAKFPDGEEVSDWARKFICPLISRGYLHGDENGYLMPKKNITREEFAQVMHNIVKTYFSEEGTYTTTGPDSTIIRKSGANLTNVTVDGDLIIGDGVGFGTVTLTNVTIKGRLLCRGGEKAIKLINTTVGDKVVVKDVNGIVHFENYRDEKVFDDILLITQATFLKRTTGGGGSSRPRPGATYYTVKFFDGMVKDADAIASKRVKKDESLKDTDEDITIDGIYNGEGVATTGNEITYRWVGKELYDGTFTHKVAPEYIFYNEETGAWEVFTEDTVLTEEIVGTDKVLEVYYAYKNIAAYLTNVIPVDALSTISINADYSAASRAADTTKVMLMNARDQLELGRGAIESKQEEVFTLLGNKSDGMITPEGIINKKPVSLKIVDVIPYNKIEGMVKDYVYNVLEEGTDEEITEVFGYVNNNTLASFMVDLLKDAETVKIMLGTDEIKTEFINSIKANKKFISSFITDKFDEIVTDEVIEDTLAKLYYGFDDEYDEELFEKAWPVIMEIMEDRYSDYADNLPDTENEKKAMINNLIGFYFGEESWDPEDKYEFEVDADELETLINDSIKEKIEDYLAYLNNPVGEKPTGYDMMDEIVNVEVDKYIAAMSDDELATTIADYATDYEETVKALIVDILDEDKDLIIDAVISYIEDARDKAYNHGDARTLNSLKAQSMDMLNSYQPYKDLMKAFKDKKETFDISIENVAFVNVIGNKIEDFSYEEIKPFLESNGYGPIIELMGKDENGRDVFEGMFIDSKTEYVTGLRDEVAKVEADNTVDTNYTTSLSVRIDFISIIKNMYAKVTSEAKSLFAGNSIYKYEENDALQAFVNIDWFNVFIKPTNDGRYQVSDFFSMYDAMLDTFILIDEAICWYGNPDNYPESDYPSVKAQLADDMTAYIDAVMNIVDQITTGQAIGGKYTINQLIEKVADLNNIVNALGESSVAAYGDTIKSLVDTMTNILTELGEGNLPGGYSLETVNTLCEKLKTVLAGISNEQYDAINNEASDIIKRALTKLDAMFDELDENGTIRGKSIEALVSKFAFAETIFEQYGSQIKKLISVIANADVDETEIDIDSEWMVDIFFGADEDNRFTVDNMMDMAPDKFKTDVNDYTETADETYIVDFYQVNAGDASLKAQRTIR